MSSAKSRSKLYADYTQIYLSLATQEPHNIRCTLKLLRCYIELLLGLSIARLVYNVVLVLVQIVSPANVHVFVDAFIRLFIWNTFIHH